MKHPYTVKCEGCGRTVSARNGRKKCSACGMSLCASCHNYHRDWCGVKADDDAKAEGFEEDDDGNSGQ